MGWTRRSVAVSLIAAMDEYRRQVGSRIAALRGERHWTHEDLAHAAGLSVKTISRAESGRVEPRGETMRRIAGALEVNLHDLTGTPPSPLGLGAAAGNGAVPFEDRLAGLESALIELVGREKRVEELLETQNTLLERQSTILEAIEARIEASDEATQRLIAAASGEGQPHQQASSEPAATGRAKGRRRPAAGK